jgi:hypothetical protein
MRSPERAGAAERVRERVATVLVHGVEPASRTTFCGGDILILPPAIDQAQRGDAAERAIHVDLLDAETVRDLEAVELGCSLLVDA